MRPKICDACGLWDAAPYCCVPENCDCLAHREKQILLIKYGEQDEPGFYHCVETNCEGCPAAK